LPHLSSRGLILRQRSESEVWLDDAHLWPDLLSLFGLDWWSDDNIITWNPVDWGGDSVLVTGLQAVNDTEDFGRVSAGGGWVGENETDGLLGVDDEYGANGESDSLRVDVGGILVVNHIVGQSDLPFFITNDWEGEVAAGDLIDILDPSSVGLNGVGGETDQLDTTLGEFWLKLCEGSELGGADWGVILWVREKDDPAIANELVEVDWAVGGVSLEVWSNASEAESWSFFGHFDLEM